ncbi:alpha-1,2-fucosyltransferase, partial [Staphylococcus aureus]|nr:alpha-1,2-fucosyltransferase [Staphylococcus aureus]
EAGANVEVEGFWNTEKYFKDAEDTIRKELTLKEKLSEEAVKVEQKIVELGKSSSLILIHVRRGDYVSNAQAMKHHGLGSVDYYTKA